MTLVRAERREKLEKLKQKDDCLRGLAASRLLDVALEAEHIPYKNVAFSYGENGKPHVLHYKMHFNLSHAGNYAVCAICDEAVGVDVESLVRLDGQPDRVQRIAKRILTDKERKHWLESGAAASELLKIWTRKESYAKMIGSGLSIGLEHIDTMDGAFYQQIQPDAAHYVTVCTQTECGPLQVFDQTLAL